MAGVAFAQAPNIPKQPPSDAAVKKAEAAQKSAEKAEAAKKAADKAAAASAASDKAEVAKKAADKADEASKAAAKAAAAQRAAAAAEAAQRTIQAPPKEVKVKDVKVPVTPPPAVERVVVTPKIPVAAKVEVPAVKLINQDIINARADNAPREPGKGPKADIPGIDRDAAAKKSDSLSAVVAGSKDRNATLADRFNDTTSNEQAAANAATGALQDDRTRRPAFDQGFGDKPTFTQDQVNDVKDASNPMGSLTGGGLRGGVADSARKDDGVTSIAEQGRGAISDGALGSSSGATVNQSGDVEAVTKAPPGSSKSFWQKLAGVFTGQSSLSGQTTNNGAALNQAINEIDGKGTPAPAGPAAGVEPAPPKGPATTSSSDGRNVVVTDADGTKNVYVDGKKVGVIEPPSTPASTPSAGRPAEPVTPLKYDIVNTSTATAQLRQSKLGKGEGVTNPDRNGETNTTSEASRAATLQVIEGQGVGRLGQPVGGGNLNDQGGRAGNVFTGSNGAGAINPGGDTVITTGGIEQNPGDVFNTGPGPDQQLRAPGSSSSSTEPAASDSTQTSTSSSSDDSSDKK
ncbi:hypothetical protein RAHE111665_10550 [Rariglobus hedericola]